MGNFNQKIRNIRNLLKLNGFKIKKCSAYLLLLANNLCFDIGYSFASVDHKTSGLDSYHNQISENQEEKAGITDIIKQHKSGTFLDIGSGRDTISYIINNLREEDIRDVNLIAADLESGALTEIAKHHPKLVLNLDKNSNIDLSLLKMDATEMHQIKDSSVKAINASAVLHEINSYVPRKTPIDRFFGETIRILQKDGYLVYRDPTLQSNPEIINSLIIKNDLAKKFVTIFLPKFLDTDLTQITDMYGNSIKPDFNYKDRFGIGLYYKGENKETNLNYKEFLSLQTGSVDFTKDITVKAPRRLLSEIQRHYILFVKNVYPLAFIDNKIQAYDNISKYTPEKAKKTVISFTKNLGVDYTKNISGKELAILTAESSKLNNLIAKGVTIDNLGDAKIDSVRKLFESRNVSTNLYNISGNKIWLDAKLLTIIYNRLAENIGSRDLPHESIKWLAREGEEYYFYYSTEELLDYLVKFCNFYLKNTNKAGYYLAPISNSHIKYAARDIYTDLLERDMLQLDLKGQKQDFVTSKTIITFKLMSSKDYANSYNSYKNSLKLSNK